MRGDPDHTKLFQEQMSWPPQIGRDQCSSDQPVSPTHAKLQSLRCCVWAGEMLTLALILSLLPLLWPPALSCCPRSIRCLRNIIHWNLISAFILRNATWFVVQLTVSPEVHQSNVVRLS